MPVSRIPKKKTTPIATPVVVLPTVVEVAEPATIVTPTPPALQRRPAKKTTPIVTPSVEGLSASDESEVVEICNLAEGPESSGDVDSGDLQSENLFFMVGSEIPILGAGRAFLQEFKWQANCNSCKDGDVQNVSSKIKSFLSFIRADDLVSARKELFHLWEIQYTLPALRVVQSLFNDIPRWLKSSPPSKVEVIEWLVNSGAPFLPYETFDQITKTPSEELNPLDIDGAYASFKKKFLKQPAAVTPARKSKPDNIAFFEDLAKELAALPSVEEMKINLNSPKSVTPRTPRVSGSKNTQGTPQPRSSPVSTDEMTDDRELKSALAESALEAAKLKMAEAEARVVSLKRKEPDPMASSSPSPVLDQQGLLARILQAFMPADKPAPQGTNALSKYLHTLDVNIDEREFINFSAFDKVRLNKIKKLGTAGRSSTSIGSGMMVSTEMSANEVEIIKTFEAFEDGLLFVVNRMHERGRSEEAHDRIKWLQWLKQTFKERSVLLEYAEDFCLKHHSDLKWIETVEKDTALLFTFLRGRPDVAPSRQQKDNPRRGKKDEKKQGRPENRARRVELMAKAPPNTCFSRVLKYRRCDKKDCKFSHACAWCKADHPAKDCAVGPPP